MSLSTLIMQITPLIHIFCFVSLICCFFFFSILIILIPSLERGIRHTRLVHDLRRVYHSLSTAKKTSLKIHIKVVKLFFLINQKDSLKIHPFFSDFSIRVDSWTWVASSSFFTLLYFCRSLKTKSISKLVSIWFFF